MPRTQRPKSPARWTDITVKNLAAPASGRVDHSDPATIGLYLTVTARGLRTWRFFYRISEPGGVVQRRDVLGRYPDMSLAEARRVAQEWHRIVAAGGDPRATKEAERSAVEAAAEAARKAAADAEHNSFAKARDDFLAKCRKDGLRRTGERQRQFGKYIPAAWDAKLIDVITRENMVALWRDIEDAHGPIMANRVIETLRAMYRWLQAEGRTVVNPTTNVRRPKIERDRDRVLSDAELAAVWKASDALGEPWRAFVRMLILTGQRRQEVATMRWSDIDLDAGTWDLPAASTKMGRAHRVPLSPLAVEVLTRLPRFVVDGKAGYLFTTSHGRRPIAAFSTAKRRLDGWVAGAAIEDWRIHDIRRTVASGMARLGVPPHVCEKVLGHEETIKGVARVYNRFDYGDEKRRALDAWAQHVQAITDDTGKVVALPARA